VTPQPERVRVLAFVTNFFVGGTERQVVNLVRGVDAGRFDVRVGCFQRTGPLLVDVEAAAVPILEYPIGRLYGTRALRALFRLAGELRRSGVQVVHAFGFYANVFAVPAARLAGVPVILASVRDTGDHLTSRQKVAQRAACRLAQRVVANSSAVHRQLVAEGYDPSQILLIRNGVDLSALLTGGGGERLRAELGLPGDVPLVGVLSRLNQLKGVEYFLEAVARLAPRFPDARFVVVGDNTEPGDEGRYRRSLEREAERRGLKGRLTFTGFRRDVRAVLAALSVSVLPSLAEGLSNSILEAMAAGVPVVATAVGGNTELIEDGVTGLLVPPRDAGALAAAVARVLEDREQARAMAQRARRRVLECFSLGRMVDDTTNLYLSLLEGDTRRREAGAWSAA
jgi:glycosyltransferase involved in cell wall biosynthesis